MTPDVRSALSAGLSRVRSGVRRALPVLGLVVLVAVLIPFVVFAVPQTVGADHGFVILSGSMEPTLSPGDAVIVDASASVEVGDVVTFDDGNTVPTTHRIIGVQDGKYVTKGDANPNPDGQLIAPDDVLGRVTLTIPLLGYAILWLDTPTGYVGLVVLPLVLLGASELYTWARRGDDDESTPKPAIRRITDAADESEATTASTDSTAATPSDDGTVTVAVTDLKLTVLGMAGLVTYAAWNVYREVVTLGAPDPISVAALTGGLLGLTFAIWVTVTARLAHRSASTSDRNDTAVSAPAKTDGGEEVDE